LAETTEALWHCLHCGAVMHLPAGTEAPHCCGLQMCNAWGDAPRSWNQVPAELFSAKLPHRFYMAAPRSVR
jgi:hypothetical protein